MPLQLIPKVWLWAVMMSEAKDVLFSREGAKAESWGARWGVLSCGHTYVLQEAEDGGTVVAEHIVHVCKGVFVCVNLKVRSDIKQVNSWSSTTTTFPFNYFSHTLKMIVSLSHTRTQQALTGFWGTCRSLACWASGAAHTLKQRKRQEEWEEKEKVDEGFWQKRVWSFGEFKLTTEPREIPITSYTWQIKTTNIHTV